MVIYRGKQPDRNYTLDDFIDKDIIVTWVKRFRDSEDNPALRAMFKSNGLYGEIRTTCTGKTYAVDVAWSWSDSKCLTTECTSIREAKSILYMWFKDQGFKKSQKDTKNIYKEGFHRLPDVQLVLKFLVLR